MTPQAHPHEVGEVVVEQIDRDAVLRYWNEGPAFAGTNAYVEEVSDSHPLVQAFARHRIAAQAGVVEALPHLASYIEQLGTPTTLEDAIRERDMWVESAAIFSRNEDYYRGLLDQIAAHIGPEAWKADDGNVVDDEPVRARLPDLIAAALTTETAASDAGAQGGGAGS